MENLTLLKKREKITGGFIMNYMHIGTVTLLQKNNETLEDACKRICKPMNISENYLCQTWTDTLMSIADEYLDIADKLYLFNDTTFPISELDSTPCLFIQEGTHFTPKFHTIPCLFIQQGNNFSYMVQINNESTYDIKTLVTQKITQHLSSSQTPSIKALIQETLEETNTLYELLEKYTELSNVLQQMLMTTAIKKEKVKTSVSSESKTTHSHSSFSSSSKSTQHQNAENQDSHSGYCPLILAKVRKEGQPCLKCGCCEQSFKFEGKG